MQNKFRCPKDYDSLYKKNLNKFYPIYQESISFINDINVMFARINSNYEFDSSKIENIHSNLEITCNFVQDILKTKFNDELLELFQKMTIEDKVRYYDADSKLLSNIYDGGLGFLCVCEGTFDENIILAPLENDLTDVSSLIHEVVHFYKNDQQTQHGKIAFGLLCETLPIYSEFLTAEYFRDHYGNKTAFYSDFIQRYELINDYSSILQMVDYNYEDIEYDCAIFEKFQYDLPFLLAANLYYQHKNNPEETRKRIKKFGSLLGKSDFNELLGSLNLQVRMNNNKLYFLKDGFTKLISSYETILKEYHQGFENAVISENKKCYQKKRN